MDSNGHYESLMEQITIIKDRVRAVAYGHATGAYIHGRPGTSKTYTVRSTLEMLAISYSYSNGHLTPIGFFDLIAENRERVIILDDVSAVLKQPIALQLLLAALGNPHDGSRSRNVRYKTAKGDQVVSFSGGIICLSNLALDGHHHEVLSALRDRVHVISYEPSDEQVCALILRIADEGIQGVAPRNARMVGTYLIEQCKLRGIRPSVRLFVDKAIEDFRLHCAGKCESHWRDLIVSDLEQQLIELQHPTRDLSRAEQTEAERRIALDIYYTHESPAERIEAWKERTGKSQPAFYRRIGELKREGRLPEPVGRA